MDLTSPEALDGRLIALRKAMAVLVAQLDDHALEALRGRAVFAGDDEDPGAGEPGPEYAIEAAEAEETRLLLEEADRHRDTN